MANRETYPASLSPLGGDVFAGAGDKQTTVVGIQRTSVSPATPNDQDVLRFSLTDGQWEPSLDTNSAIYVNGIPVSDDYLVYVNANPIVTVNGV